MRCLGRTIGCMLLSMIIMITPMAIWMVVAWGGLINNVDSYVENLDDESYNDMAVLVIPAVAQFAGQNERGVQNEEIGDSLSVFSNVIANLDGADWREIIDGKLDPEWVKDLLQTNLNYLIDYWNYETDYLVIEADFAPIVAVLSEDSGEQITQDVFAAYQNLDECDAIQNQLIEDTVTNQNNNMLPKCYPNTENLERIQAQFVAGRDYMVARLTDLPDSYLDVRAQQANADALEQYDSNMHDVRRGFFMVDQALPVILLFPLMLLSLIVVITVRSAKGFFLWTSIALIGISFLTIFPLIPWMYGLIFNTTDSGLVRSNDAAFNLGLSVQRVLFGEFSGPILLSVGVMIFIGFGFLLLAALLRNPHATQPQQVYYYVPSGQTGSYANVATSGSSQLPIQPAPNIAPPGGSSAVERHKEELNTPELQNDRTFIPSDTQSGKQNLEDE